MAPSPATLHPSPPGATPFSTARRPRSAALARCRIGGRPPHRPSTPTPAIAAAAAAAATAPPPTWIPYLSLGAGTYCAALAALMAFAPDARATRALAGVPASTTTTASRTTRRPLAADLALLPPALAYLALLVASWTPDTVAVLLPGSLAAGLAGGWAPQFFPRLSGVAALFARPRTAASLAVHLAAVGLLAARSAYVRGLDGRAGAGGASVSAGPEGEAGRGRARAAGRRLVQAPVILLLAFVGPLGLAVQAGVEWGRRRWGGGAGRGEGGLAAEGV